MLRGLIVRAGLEKRASATTSAAASVQGDTRYRVVAETHRSFEFENDP